MTTLLDPARNKTEPRSLPGLEPDNLLAFLALLGLLRALETARPDWQPRISWKGPPWIAQLHLGSTAEQAEVANATNDGIAALIKDFDSDDHKNVDFDSDQYRSYAKRMRRTFVGAALASALASERPVKKAGGPSAAPLVMMFGQGWQNFFERLIDVPSGKLPNRLRKLKSPPDMRDPGKIAEALFQPWRRADDVDGFRWDPEEDQRYALRFGDPSRAGAAATVLGANRLAPIGFLSFPALPAERQMQAVGALRDGGEWCFAWPIWTSPLSRSGIEALLAHPMLRDGDRGELRRLGVVEIYRARRIANGKFMNVTRARPVEAAGRRSASDRDRSSRRKPLR